MGELASESHESKPYKNTQWDCPEPCAVEKFSVVYFGLVNKISEVMWE